MGGLLLTGSSSAAIGSTKRSGVPTLVLPVVPPSELVDLLADQAFTGSGDITTAGLATAGTGLVGVIGSGAITLAGLNTAGTGLVGVLGSGSIVTAGLNTAGTGKVGVLGAGTVQTAGLATAGLGSVANNIGAGTIQTSGLNTAGSGSLTFSGSGAVAQAGLNTAGAGNVIAPVTGSGAVAQAGLNTAGAGNVVPPITGSGAMTVGGLRTAGTQGAGIDPYAWFPGDPGPGPPTQPGRRIRRNAELTEEEEERRRRRRKHRHPLRIPKALRALEPLAFPPPLDVLPLPEALGVPDLAPVQLIDPAALRRPVDPAVDAAVMEPIEPEAEGAHWTSYAHLPYTAQDEVEDLEAVLAAVLRRG